MRVKCFALTCLLSAAFIGGPTLIHAADGAEGSERTADVQADADARAEADALVRAEQHRIERELGNVAGLLARVREVADDGDAETALEMLEQAIRQLPANPVTQQALERLHEHADALQLDVAKQRLKRGDAAGARQALISFERTNPSTRETQRLRRRINEMNTSEASEVPRGDAAPQPSVEHLREQLRAGALDQVEHALRAIEEARPHDRDVQALRLELVAAWRAVAEREREQARLGLLLEVDQGWQRPVMAEDRPAEALRLQKGRSPLAEKLANIRIPSVSFQAIDLKRVAATLSELSTEYDAATEEPLRGVNIVVIDPQERNPNISLTLRNLSLKRVLDFITDSVGYRYEVETDAVVIRPGGEVSALDTEFFPVTRSTVIRMTGVHEPAPATVEVDSLFAPAAANPGAGVGGGEAEALRGFLQQAGVNFEGTPGASLAYDGSAMIVTQTARNLERIRNILNRYNDVRQVEIEAKFMEVQQGALEELGVNWSATHGRNGDPRYLATVAARNRSLAEGFTHTVSGQSGRIVNPGRETEVIRNPDGTIFEVVPGQNSIDLPIINQAASLPGGADLAAQADPLAVISGAIGDFDVEATIRALSRHAGTDLLSAPKVTVLSGHPATITVAQEMRFPQSYGEIQSQVGSARSESSSAGVTITAGTPQDFMTRNIGVELRVTPTVEEDDYSISLDLNPKVTEFEGFVEYGGQSIAISGGTTVTVPSGFFQPVFSTREVNTKVTLWDGATLVMGGLTREEVKQVNDKVPILGDIPLLGRMFRSKGESSQKRNLLIFVTANLVSPGGSPKKQTVRGVPPSALYQTPTFVTPSGPESRVR